MEEWRDIKGYEGFYQVSNFGRVKSLDRKIVYKNFQNYKNLYLVLLISRILVLTNNEYNLMNKTTQYYINKKLSYKGKIYSYNPLQKEIQ